MSRPSLFRTAAVVLVAAAALLSRPLAAQDDTENTTPTTDAWVHDIGGADLLNLCQSQNLRIISLDSYRRGSSGIETYNAALVSNTGAYQKDWWLFENLSTAEVDLWANTLNARPISIASYRVYNRGLVHTVVMIRNTGPDYRVWSWGADLNEFVAVQTAVQTNSRIIGFSLHSVAQMSAIYVRNVGPTARNWRMFLNDSVTNITAFAAQNGMRITDWRARSGGFAAILIEDPVPVAGWQLVLASRAQIEVLRQQQKARLLAVHGGYNDRFVVTLIDNAKPLERNFRNMFNARSDGFFGVRVDEIGGDTLVDIYGDLRFEPAETMTTMLHLHAMRQVQLGNISLRNLLPVNVSGRACPDGTGTPSPAGLGSILEDMMEGNDLDRTYAVAPRRWSFAEVNATASSLGLRDTRLEHVIGCNGPTPNVTTLEDLGKMHRLAGTLLQASNRESFRSAMENSTNFPTWGTGSRDLVQRISDEATRRNFTLGRRIAFGGELKIAYKAGTYAQRSGSYVCEAGWISVPYLDAAGSITRREYTFGAFNVQAGSRSAARGLVSDALLEAVWPLVRDAMETWDDGGSSIYGQGCAGLRGVPSLDTRDVPNIGRVVELSLERVPFGSLASFWFGLRNASPLPIPATSCDLLLQPVHSIATSTGFIGRAVIGLPIPNDPSLAGTRVAVQCSVVDASANALGLSFSNGLELRIGQ